MPAGRGNAQGDDSDGEDVEAADNGEKKLRFVWSSEMHSRFEAAVHKLGVLHAKPQSIRQLMGCEGEEAAPTRQNIKSHLQKYRLLLHKQAGFNAQHGETLPGQAGPSQAGLAGPALHVQSPQAGPSQHSSQLQLQTQEQEQGQEQAQQAQQAQLQQQQAQQKPLRELEHGQQLQLLFYVQQMELHAKLHEQLMVQQRAQVELSHKLTCSSHAVLAPDQLMRLAQHVMLQRQLLQHLFAMLHVNSEDVLAANAALAASTSTQSSNFMQVDEVPTQAEVMSSFGEAAGDPPAASPSSSSWARSRPP